jgi:hypothetical protein
MAKRTKKQSSSNVEDIYVTNPRETDVIIPVLGLTGAGRSTFINAAAGAAVTAVGDEGDLMPCTGAIQPVVVPYPSKDVPTRRIVFVDTPGFTDTWVNDAETLRRIVNWLEISCNSRMKLAGIIYLHDISQSRIATAKGNLDLFYNPSVVDNVILATTKGVDLASDVESRREQQLSQQCSTGLHSFHNTPESAWTIVNHVLNNIPDNALPIQEQLIKLLGGLPSKTQPSTPGGIFRFLFRKRP